MIRTPLLLAMLGLITTGCASRQTFDVTVTNRLSEPVTVWMTKLRPASGDQYERGWMPPEVAAIGSTEGSTQLGGVAIEPGETAHTNLTGTIASDDVAVLRVYRSVDLNSILAINRGSPDRLDLPLNPGKTDIDVIKKDGRLIDVPHGGE